MLSTILIQFYGWIGFNPITSIFIALLISASVIPLVIDTGKVLALDVAQRADGITQALDEVASSAHSSLCLSLRIVHSSLRWRASHHIRGHSFGQRTRAA
jgi:Co/Zn/Cd efflux system component